jgi:putative addiction module killer protein
MIEVREYIDAQGKNFYRDWLVGLDTATRAQIVAGVLLMEFGNFSAAKSVGSGVSEMRLDFGPGYRVYFGKDAEQLVILSVGGSKRRQQADISAAHRLWIEYKRRKQEERDAPDKKLSRND